MTPEFCVCICNNSHWFLQDFGSAAGKPYFCWTSEPAQAYRLTRHEAAISIAQTVKHAHPNETVRLMEFPQNKVRHDTNPASA